MTNFKVFSIPKHVLPQEIPNPKNWEIFDDDCNRADIKLNAKILDDILSLSGKNLFRDK